MIAPENARIGVELLRLWRGSWRRVELPFVGRSMEPLTRKADGILISLGGKEPRAGDILLSLQKGSLTAHRAIRSRATDGGRRWTTQGDSCLARDPEPTPATEVLARVVGLVEKTGETRLLLGPFWRLAGAWAAGQLLLLGPLARRLVPRSNSARQPRPAGRLALLVHRRVLSAVFFAAGCLEKIRACMADWQVHAFRSPLWRLAARDAKDAPPSADLFATALLEAESYGMSLVVLRRLQGVGIEAPASLAEDLARREAAAAFQVLRRRARLEQVIQALRQRGIPHMAMKGLAQSLTLYQGNASREMQDVDLLVPPNREAEARQAMQELGFQSLSGPGDPDFPHHHHEAPQLDEPSGLIVEIHREVVPKRVLKSGLADGFRRRAEAVEFAGDRLAVPCREDRLLHLCLHLRLHRYLGCLRDVLEIATLVEEEEASWDWGRVEAIASEADGVSPLYTGLRLAAVAFKTPIPEEFLEHLSQRLPRTPFRELRIRFLARRLTGPAPERRGRRVKLVRWLCKQAAPA